jgi:hypothetical protein
VLVVVEQTGRRADLPTVDRLGQYLFEVDGSVDRSAAVADKTVVVVVGTTVVGWDGTIVVAFEGTIVVALEGTIVVDLEGTIAVRMFPPETDLLVLAP